MWKWLIGAAAVLLLAFFVVIPRSLELILNRKGAWPPYAAPAFDAPAVDLHADPLLWGRDLLERSSKGHVDLPRLQDAHMRVQVFGVVTKAPLGMNLVHNEATAADMVTALALASGWPPEARRSLAERALYQAARLRDMSARSGGKLVLIRSRADLEALPQGAVGALLALEGSHALEGSPANIDRLYDAGFRMMSPAHFFDTEVGGSAHGAAKGGLTPFGRAWLAKLEEKHILVDLAHASPQTFDEIVKAAKRPVVVSHTGVRATCDNQRNLSDAQLKQVAATGGLVGVGFWESATCGKDAAAAARAMRHAADVIGFDHVALGSDFDGAVKQPFDVTGLPLLAEALRKERFTDDEIRAMFGGNALRLLAHALP